MLNNRIYQVDAVGNILYANGNVTGCPLIR